MIRVLTIASALTITLLAMLPASWAGESGHLAVAVQAVGEDGDAGHFAENSGGLQSGVALESLRWQVEDDEKLITLDAAFDTGRSGWFDLSVRRGAWTLDFSSTIKNGWSDTSFANDYLPSGTAVSGLFPGTTALASSFGVDEPRLQRIWAVARLQRRFSASAYLRLNLRLNQNDGERVPSFGGYSFSEVGTLAAYTAGLERFDSDASELSLEAGWKWAAITFRGEAGLASRTDSSRARTPVWGVDEQLAWNDWSSNQDVDTRWLALSAAWSREQWSVFGSALYSTSELTPRWEDRELDPSGALAVPGLQVKTGKIDQSRWAGALGTTWSPRPHLALTASVDARNDQRDGNLSLDLLGSSFAAALADRDERRAGITLSARTSFGGGRLRARVRQESSRLDTTEKRDEFLQVTRRDRDLLRADVRYSRKVKRTRVNLWGRYRKIDTTVDLIELFDGYITGDRQTKESAFGGGLVYTAAHLRAGVEASVSSTDVDSDRPAFDPIFDPSQTLTAISGQESQKRLSGNLGWTGERAQGWIEVGLITLEYDYSDSGVAGAFVPLSEKVTGTVVALGGQWSAWRKGNLRARLEMIDDGSDLDRQLTRASLEASHSLREKLDLFARWSMWDLVDARAKSDEYTYQIFTAGARLSW